MDEKTEQRAVWVRLRQLWAEKDAQRERAVAACRAEKYNRNMITHPEVTPVFECWAVYTLTQKHKRYA